MEAKAYSEVTFDLPERMEEVLVQTGQRVKKGAVLARLRDFELQNQLQKINHQLEQATNELESKLVSLGYSLQDSSQIPPAILKTAKLGLSPHSSFVRTMPYQKPRKKGHQA